MYSKARVYNNPTSLVSAPSIGANSWFLSQAPEDQRLRQLFLNRIKDTKVNREISFWNEPVVISFAYITAYTILGDTIKVLTKDAGVKDMMSEFFSQMNADEQSIEDFFCDAYVDNIIHADSVWRIMETDELTTGIDLARLDPTTYVRKKNRTRGYSVFVQYAKKESQHFYNKNGYYNYWKQNAGAITQEAVDEIIEDAEYDELGESIEYVPIVIPNELQYCVELKLFRRPPISSVLDHLAYKRWILWFMRQYAERYWAPPRVIYVGDPQFYMPDDEIAFKKERDNALQALLQLKNFGAMATPGYNKVEEVGNQTAKSSEIYVDYMNYLNEELMFMMFGSMGIRSAKGTELATSRVLEQGYLRVCRANQGRFDMKLRRLCTKRVLPKALKRSEPLTLGSLDFRHSPMVLDDISKTVKAVKDACDAMLFEDWNEPRQILQSVFGTVMDELPPDVAEKLKNKFVEMNSAAAKDPFGGAKPAAKKPGAKPSGE
jgi:hypothetical protein